MRTRTIGLLGEDRGHTSHRELNALVSRLSVPYPDVDFSWIPTDSGFDVAAFDGVWLVPGSPYADDQAVIDALHYLRRSGTPFLGTCGGMQYAVMEFLRTEGGLAATHAETDGESGDNAVERLACSLYGVESLIEPVPGTKFARLAPESFLGMHFCNYAPSSASIAALQAAGVVVGATGPGVGAEVLEFPDHPFYITSMFQPHIGASAGRPIHPLINAFVRAVQTVTSVETSDVQKGRRNDAGAQHHAPQARPRTLPDVE